MQNATLKALPRSETGKGAARKLRATGRIPAVLYGHGEASQELSVDAHELKKLLAAVNVENTLIDLEIDGAEPARALVREVQMHPFRPEALHLDLFHVHAGEKLHLKIPIRLVGNAAGVRVGGGTLDQVIYELDVECLPGDIPDVAEMDVTEMQIGDSIRVHDISLANARILNDPELPIASIAPPMLQPVTEPAEDGAEEPELVRGGAEDEDAPRD